MRRESSISLIEHMRKLQVACGDLKTEAARYRAALEVIEAGMWIEQGSRDEMFQSIQRAVAIAHRALHPEEDA